MVQAKCLHDKGEYKELLRFLKKKDKQIRDINQKLGLQVSGHEKLGQIESAISINE